MLICTVNHLNNVSGTTILHTELEQRVASFVGKSAAVVFGMGYATNSAVLPALIGKVHPITWTRIVCDVLHLYIVPFNQFGCREV